MRYCVLIVCVLLLVVAVGCQNTPDKDLSIPPDEPVYIHTPTPTQTPTPVLEIPSATTTPTPAPTPDRMAAMEKFMLGSLLMDEGKNTEAANAFLDAYQIDPVSAVICSSAAKALLLCGNIEDAERLASQSIQLEPQQTEAYEVLAQCYINMQNEAKAVTQYETLLRLKPDTLDYMDTLADLYVKVQRYNQAIVLFRKIINQNPQQPVWFHMRLAILLFDLKRYPEALEEYQYLVKEFPESFEAHFQLGSIHKILNHEEEAINSFFNALNHIHSKQNEISVRKELGQLFKMRNALPETVHQYESIKSLDPQDLDARKELALLYAEQNNQSASLNEIDELIQQKPDDFSLQELRFELLVRFGKEKQAYQNYLDELSQRITNNGISQINQLLGILLHKETLDEMKPYGQIQSLENLLKQCDNMPDEPVRIHFALVYFYDWLGNPSLKEKQQQIIIQTLLQAGLDQDMDQLDMICMEFLNWPLVRKTFQYEPFFTGISKALQDSSSRHPSMPMPDRVLGAIAIDRQDWSKAESALNNALQRMKTESGEYKEVLFQLAWVYERMNRIADVEQLMEEAQKFYPNDANVFNYLGYMYADRNIHLDKSLELIEKAFKMEPDNANIMDSMGWVYYRLERYPEALKMLQRAIVIDEEHPVIALHLGDVYHQLGNPVAAVPYWKQALESAVDYPDEFTEEKIAQLKEKIYQAGKSE